jgi:solute carrier family 25 (adenine nucleotide translocator) protein 4/5/6/31
MLRRFIIANPKEDAAASPALAVTVPVPAAPAPSAPKKEKKGTEVSATAFFIDFAAGGISGAVAKTCTAPIERVKLIIQTQDSNPLIRSGKVARYTGIGNCFTRVYQEQGLKAFWRGNLTNVIRYFPTQAFNFAFKDSIKALFPRYSSKTEFGKFFLVNMASGGLAGAGSLCIVYPLDYARTRLASDVGSGQKSFNGLADCLVKTAKGPGGFMGLYNGFGVSVIGIIPYRGAYFGVNDSLAGINPWRRDKGPLRVISVFACAQTAAISAGYASYPFDTVRRRLQMQSEKPKSEWLYKGTMDCFRKISAEEGVSALFKGAGANALRTVGSALVLVLYSEFKTFMGFEGGAGGSE